MIGTILLLVVTYVGHDIYRRYVPVDQPAPNEPESQHVPSELRILGLQIVTEIKGFDSTFCNTTVVARNNVGYVDESLWGRFFPEIPRDALLASGLTINAFIRLYASVKPGDSWRSGEIRAQLVWPETQVNERVTREFSSVGNCSDAAELALPEDTLTRLMELARTRYMPVTAYDAGSEVILEAVLCGTDTSDYYPLELDVSRNMIGARPVPRLDIHRAQLQILLSHDPSGEEWIIIPSASEYIPIAKKTITEDATVCIDGQRMVTIISMDFDTTIVFDHRSRAFEK